MRRFRLVLPAVITALAVAHVLNAQPPARAPRKVAILVGPTTYLHDFRPLSYAAADVTALAKELRAADFDEVIVLTDPPEGAHPATRANVLARLEGVLTKNRNPAHNVRRGDVVLLALAGHGQELEVPDPANPGKTRRDTFFAPIDGRLGKPDTLISLSHLVDDVLAPCGGRNLLLVDACREVYSPNRGRGISGKHVSLTGETAVMFSCSTTELSWESDELKHGVFTHAVLEVMREAGREAKPVTWSGLVAGVESVMESAEFRRHIPSGQTQTPVLAAGQVPATTLYRPRRAARPRPLTGDNTAAQVKAAQKAWADYLKVPVEYAEDLGGGVKLEMMLIPPGTFWMGSPAGEAYRNDDETQHEVTLTGAFYLGKYPVTQEQYEQVAGGNPSHFSATGGGKDRVVGLDTRRHPVEQVSWEDVAGKDASDERAFLPKLNRRVGGGRPYRLPTEAEWEYSCRGGAFVKDSLPYHLSDGPATSLLTSQANFKGGPGRTTPVDKHRPNRFGLFDTHSNVFQWCADFFEKYPDKETTDPGGPATGSHRVARGGGWNGNAGDCRAGDRGWIEPGFRNGDLGFRLARSPSGLDK